ncbi:tRNA:Cm32/Um32 methyltransferase [Dissulfuribacter thermophilus]|uniref:tRNA (cytidine/uridine-2'-O-)-methyltransferase TrmJ n=1 Tax=Dissulfuribacter thermophilus TaxID=1156395 RepID=A0A1B9F713_9BACT|nr:RNA methyltransferase [Dissulfuribacter thermophilus]OCC15673.1 tRNA:Cm32/Um32 methyltransferase [Dissulfuribacter thermophilus]
MKVNLKNCYIVLNEPRYPENIGASARAIMNMGLGGLIVVNPYRFDMDAINKMATHEASSIVEEMKVYDDILEALAQFNYCVGTTARTGRGRRPTHTPRTIGPHVAPLSQENKIAFLFGSEKFGLSNQVLRLCQAIVTIPTADFSSLNLAQSVMIISYELFQTDLPQTVFTPQLANLRELEGMYEHLKEVFLEVGYINPENPDYFMQNFRKLFSRIQLRKKEVKMIRGFCRQLLWRINSLK